MSAASALLWREARQLRRELVVYAALVALMPPLSAAMGSLVGGPDGAAAALLACFALPAVAALLGASLAAGDPALPFLSARAADWSSIVSQRLALRAGILLGLGLLGLATLMLLTPDGASLMRLEGAARVTPVALVGATAFGFFFASATASAFTRRPLAAAAAGLAGYLLLCLGLGYALEWLHLFDALEELAGGGRETWLHRIPAIAPVAAPLSALLAALALERRRETRPLPGRRSMIVGGGALIGLCALVWLVLFAGARFTIAKATAAWAEVPEPPAATLPAEPFPRESNEAAVRLAELAAELGLPLERDRWRDREARGLGLSGAAAELQRLRRPDAGTQPLRFDALDPTVLVELLAPHASALERLRLILLDDPPPRWPPQSGYSLGPVLDLHRLLLADAVASGRSGERDRSVADFEASWRLNEVLLGELPEDSDLHGYLSTGDIVVTWQAEAVLGSGLALPELEARLAALAAMDLPSRSLRSILGAARRRLEAMRKESWPRPLDARRWASHENPIASAGPALVHQDPCSRRLAGGAMDPDAEYHWPLWFRAVRAQARVELALRVLELRRLRDEAGGHWPAGAPSLERSPCPDARWDYHVSPEGLMSLELVGDGFNRRHEEDALPTLSSRSGPVPLTGTTGDPDP